MFDNNNTNTFFGAQAPTISKKSLFGNNNTDGLFNNQYERGGLFENTKTSIGGGLFSNSNQQNNSLFSKIDNNNTSSNLFSNTNTANIFGNNKITNNLFNTQSNPNILLFSNTNSNNNQSIFQTNNNNTIGLKDSTFGIFFNGINIQNNKDNLNFMSITALPDFSYASNEELRLADYEKKQTGNIMKFRINNTSNNKHIIQNDYNSNNFNFSLNNNHPNKNGGGLFNTTTTKNLFGENSTFFFGSNNTSTQTKGIFGNNQTTQENSIFGKINNNQRTNIFGNNTNNNQRTKFFENANNNQGNSLFGSKTSNNIQSGGLFGNSNIFGNNNEKPKEIFDFTNNNTIGNTFFGNNTNTTGGLFGNNNTNSTSGNELFRKNSTRNNNIFGNNLSNNQTGGLFGNNNSNQSGNIFENNTNIIGGGLFGNSQNNNSNQGPFFFGNNRDKKGDIFGNINNNTKGNSIFNNDKNSSFHFSNNNIKTDKLFGNSTNNESSLFNNNNTNTSLLLSKNNTGNINLLDGGIFGIKQNDKENKNKGNNLFGNNTPSLFNNTLNNKTNTIFENANNCSNTSGLFNQKNNSLSHKNKTNINSNSKFNNTNNKQTLSLFGNDNNQQISNNMPNSQDNIFYSDITYEDIVNPINFINIQKTLKLSPEDEILSKSIVDAIQKQKSVEEFLEDLDKKYNNNENTDILSSYGTYLSSSTNYENNQPTLTRKLDVRKNKDSLLNSYINMKNRKLNNEQNNENSIYNKIDLNKSILKINEIYDEYERYKNKFMINNENIQMENSQFEELNLKNKAKMKNIVSDDNTNANNKSTSYINKKEMIGKDEGLFQRNLIEFNKLSNYNISKINKETEDNNEILIKIFKNEKDNKNNNKMLDLIIKFRFPDNEEDNNNNNISKIKLDNINQSIKIKTLKEEIKERIYKELKHNNLDKKYWIEKISLLIPGVFLNDSKKLIDYNLAENDFKIEAFITYNSNSSQNENGLQIKKNQKSHKEIKIKKEINLNKDELVPIDLVPKLTKDGYKCSPSIVELCRKTADELRNVENFKIFNKYGEIEFKEPVNLLGLNLDNQITIEKNLIDTGDKLDYWAIYKLFNFKTKENGLKKHKIDLEKYGGNFLYYKNNELAWEYNGKKEKVGKN